MIIFLILFCQDFFCLGLSMGCSELEFPGQTASFERRRPGAAPTPLALPYPFGTSTWTRMDAERDKREVAKILYFDEVILRLRLYLDVCRVWMISKIGIISKR